MASYRALGVCRSLGTVYLKTFRGSRDGFDAYLEDAGDLTEMPENLKDEDPAGIVFDGEDFVFSQDGLDAIRGAEHARNVRALRVSELRDVRYIDAILAQLKHDRDAHDKHLIPQMNHFIERWQEVIDSNPF